LGANINEIMSEVAEHGARLRVEERYLALRGDIPEDLKAKLREYRQELVRELTWDQERAYALLREALDYVDGIYVAGAEIPAEREDDLHDAIDRAFVSEDMWAFRVARRAWITAWTEAVAKAKGGGVAA
jgi:hypothetical protein